MSVRKSKRGIPDGFPFFADVRKRRRGKKRSHGEEGQLGGRERRSASAVRLEQETHHLRRGGVEQKRKVSGENFELVELSKPRQSGDKLPEMNRKMTGSPRRPL